MATNIYAITDSHQEARNLSGLFSGIYSFEKNNGKPFLLLDCGDLFKGIYDKGLCTDTYLKFKNLLPNANIFITLGNNDFGFNQDNFEYLKQTIKRFENNGIHFVCANLKDTTTSNYSDLVSRYKVLEINNEKILITGFCLNTSVMKNFNLEFEDAKISILNLLECIDEKYDRIFVLNHHWYPYSKELYEFCQNKEIKIDLIIGGHEHSKIEPDYSRNIFYPLSFARSFYKMELDNDIENVKEYSAGDFAIIPELEEQIDKYEKETHLFEPVAKRVLNLVKWYSEPCALGTFISDNMKRVGNTDIAFHSTGFTMYSLKTG
ncbi:metallophosphoesterase, partial [bacterium]|nr:metallophosphoesterase [bacterium]